MVTSKTKKAASLPRKRSREKLNATREETIKVPRVSNIDTLKVLDLFKNPVASRKSLARNPVGFNAPHFAV
jgi:hypothetical protein